MNDIFQFYAILGIKHTASPEATKKAYRNLAKIWHPDRYLNNPVLKAKAEVEIKKINQAYGVIKTYQAEKENINNFVKKNIDPSAKYPARAKVSKTQNTPEFHYQQGVSYAEKQNYSDALTSFAQAIKLNSNYLEAYQYRGFILSKLGYEYQADAEFKKAHQIKVRNKFNKSYNYHEHKYESQVDTYQKSTAKATSTNQAEHILQCYRTILVANKSVRCLAISQQGFIVSVNNALGIDLWQVNTGQKIDILHGHKEKVTCLAISSSGQTLISGSKDKTIKLWDLEKRKIIRTLGKNFSGHLNKIVALVISPNNQTLLSCDADNSLKIWDVNRAREIQNISFSAAITCLAISPDGQLFCSGGLEAQLRIRQLKNGQVIRSINNGAGVLSLAFSPDGNLLATGGFNRTIKLWDLSTARAIYTLEGHLDRVSQVIFSNNGKTLISSSWDKTIKLWNLATGKEIANITGHSSKIYTMAIAPDHKTLISGSADKTIKLWQCNW